MNPATLRDIESKIKDNTIAREHLVEGKLLAVLAEAYDVTKPRISGRVRSAVKYANGLVRMGKISPNGESAESLLLASYEHLRLRFWGRAA